MPFRCFKKEKESKSPKSDKKKGSDSTGTQESTPIETSTGKSPRSPKNHGKNTESAPDTPVTPSTKDKEDLISSESSSAPEPLPYVIGQMSPRPVEKPVVPPKPKIVAPLAISEVPQTPVKAGSNNGTPRSAKSPRNSTARGSFSGDRARTNSISAGDWTKIRAETDQKIEESRPAILQRKMTLAMEMEDTLTKLKMAEAERTDDELDLNALDDLDLDSVAVAVETFRAEDYDEGALEDKLLGEAITAQVEADVRDTKKTIEQLQDSDGSHDLAELDDLYIPSDLEMPSESENSDHSYLEDNSDSEVEVPASKTSPKGTANVKVSSHVHSTSTNDDHSITEETHTDLSTTTPRHNHQASLQDEDSLKETSSPRTVSAN
jgi:hypothetical protein